MSYKDLPFDYEPAQPSYWRKRKELSERQIAIRVVLFTLGGFCLFLHLLLPD